MEHRKVGILEVREPKAARLEQWWMLPRGQGSKWILWMWQLEGSSCEPLPWWWKPDCSGQWGWKAGDPWKFLKEPGESSFSLKIAGTSNYKLRKRSQERQKLVFLLLRIPAVLVLLLTAEVQLYIYMYIHIHIYIDAHIHIHTNTHMFIHMWAWGEEKSLSSSSYEAICPIGLGVYLYDLI